MAKCNLSIELDEPDRVYQGGEKVRGQVIVRADAEVVCKGLTVTSTWATHGRGNVDRREVASETLFQGNWQAGNDYRYRFELPSATWPPTVHGHYLNVDHYIEARADIPWAFDPKASVPFQLTPTAGPETIIKRKVTELKGATGFIIGSLFVLMFVVFLVVMAINPFFWGFILIAAGIGFSVWLFKSYLPARRMGDVSFTLDASRLLPGEKLSGSLSVQPRRAVTINGITVVVAAKEVCVSGSGSNRTTHRHTLFEQNEELSGGQVLQPMQANRFTFEVQLPEQPYYSLDLNDNDLKWSADVRIDIPRWPDWHQSEEFEVLPATALGREAALSEAAGEPPNFFAETVGHLWAARDDDETRARILEAVAGMQMRVSGEIERRLLSETSDERNPYRDGHVVWGHYTDPPLPLTLYVREEDAARFEQIAERVWEGDGEIVGWDRHHDRLQIRVI